MILRSLQIGRWWIEFYFAPDGYDQEEILDRMYSFGAPGIRMRQAYNLMESGDTNTGFTFHNPEEALALVVVGPTSNSAQFLNTFSHEIRHLANAIAEDAGVHLASEMPSYVTGDTVEALAEVICELGCPHCH